MKKLRPGNTRLRLHGNKNEAQKLRTFAMRKLQGFLSTCHESMQICGPWKIKFEDGSECVVRQVFDVPIVDIFVPYPVVHVPERVEPKKKGEITKRLEELWARGIYFTPGFYISEPRSSVYTSFPYENWAEVAVCEGGSWDAFLTLAPELYRPEDHGEYVSIGEDDGTKPARIVQRKGHEGRAVTGLLMVAEQIWYTHYFDWDGEDDHETEEDTGFVPGPLPYMGSFKIGASGGSYLDESARADGSYDYLMQKVGTPNPWVVVWGELCTPDCYWDGCIGNEPFVGGDFPEADPGWTRVSGQSGWVPIVPRYMYGQEGNIVYNDNDGCKKSETTTEMVLSAIRCGHGHLFSEWYAMSLYEEWWWGQSRISGICMGYSSCISKHVQFLGHETQGNTQERTKEVTSTESYFMTDYYGNMKIKSPNFKYELESVSVAKATFSNCRTWEERASTVHTGYPEHSGAGGGLTKDGYNESLDGTFFFLYQLDEVIYDRDGTYAPWSLYYYGYDEDGVWHDGDFGLNSGGDYTQRRYERKRKLSIYAYLDGEHVLLDELPWVADKEDHIWSQHFRFTCSFIFDFYGVPVYMYSYACSPSAANEPEYVRYGYFLGTKDNHVRSEEYPCGDIKTNNGEATTYHDVFGFAESQGKYAEGGCAGFAVHKEFKTGEVEYETLLRR